MTRNTLSALIVSGLVALLAGFAPAAHAADSWLCYSTKETIEIPTWQEPGDFEEAFMTLHDGENLSLAASNTTVVTFSIGGQDSTGFVVDGATALNAGFIRTWLASSGFYETVKVHAQQGVEVTVAVSSIPGAVIQLQKTRVCTA